MKDKLEQKMLQAAQNLQFEEAQRIKEIISHLSFTTTQQDVDLNDELNRDVFNYFQYEDYLCFIVLFYRNGKLTFKNTEVIKNEGQDIIELFKSFILQIYAKNILPDYIIVPSEVESDDLQVFFGEKIVDNSQTINQRLLDLASSNAQEYLYQEIHYKNKEVTKEELLTELQQLLQLSVFPYQIEMYDIANIMDEFVTGAMVVYKNGFASHNDLEDTILILTNEGITTEWLNWLLAATKKIKIIKKTMQIWL
ncbi:UvrB/UvrC motif-containing protein [Spiroplasma clarkii]|uniref:UvrB/UvrC motif-containing protein n=1 Tax=Spiroplasma clarkii TaxID=2139 RepID=UPI00202A30E1|nr:UvrB/UvrC motif-containing protein [Spiroplasma clarkii]